MSNSLSRRTIKAPSDWGMFHQRNDWRALQNILSRFVFDKNRTSQRISSWKFVSVRTKIQLEIFSINMQGWGIDMTWRLMTTAATLPTPPKPPLWFCLLRLRNHYIISVFQHAFHFRTIGVSDWRSLGDVSHVICVIRLKYLHSSTRKILLFLDWMNNTLVSYRTVPKVSIYNSCFVQLIVREHKIGIFCIANQRISIYMYM